MLKLLKKHQIKTCFIIKKQIDYENEETKYFSNKRVGTCNVTTIYN